MKWLFLLIVFVPLPVLGQELPFSKGSMTSTTVTTQTVEETIKIQRFGGAYGHYSGNNITPSSNITADGTTFALHTAGDDFQLEIVTRAAGLGEQEDIERVVETESTTTSLSVFSQ